MAEWGSANYMIGSRFDRPASTQTAIHKKNAEREELLTAVKEFLAQGGSIKTIPYGVSKERQLHQMREGQLELITQKELADRWQLRGGTIPTVLANFPMLMYIMKDGEKCWWIEDIRRIEETKSKILKGARGDK